MYYITNVQGRVQIFQRAAGGVIRRNTMSSGSNAPRKPNVASTLFKASSRLLHGQAQGAGSKSMKRQRQGGASLDGDVLSAESNSNIPDEAAGLDERKESLGAGPKSKKRFVGVRQRPSGRWVAEIKDTTQKIRLWLGTFDSAEEGAKAYDSAARALRGANTRTNFVPAMACEGTTMPASKAARLIRLRQMAAASKACEKVAARKAAAPRAESQKGADHSNLKVVPQVNDSSGLVRQDLQQSISSLDPLPSPATSPAIVGDHTPHLPAAASSPPKPPRLIGRRHNVPPQLAFPKPEQEDDAPPFAAIHDHGTVEDGSPCIKFEVVDPPSPPKLEPQKSVTSENLSNAINHSLVAGSPQDSSSPPLSFPSPSSPFDRVQLSSTVIANGGAVQSVKSFLEASDHLKSFHKERFLIQRPPPVESSFSAFTVDNFVAPVPARIPFHALEASRQLMFRSEHNIISGLVAFSHHQLSTCATNRDHVSMYPSEKDEVICRGRSLRSCMDGPMSLEDEKCVTTETQKCCETRASTVRKEEVDYASSEMYRMEAERKIDKFILREKEFAELHVPEIPWPDYVLMDETGMESGLLGLDLSCENSGVYTSAFDFSAEAIDRDSCTSVMLEHEHLSDDSEFLLRMQYEQSSNSPAQNFPQECVLLTEPPELDYSMSPHESSLPGPPLSPQETQSLSISSSLLWRMDDASACWDGQSSGSTETTDLKPSTGDGGECTSQDHEALWSSMDLTPLCMVA